MVFPDLNPFSISDNKHKPLVPIRILSCIIDYFIFAPVISFLVLVLFHSGLDIYRSFPRSLEAQSVFGYLAIAYILLIAFFQALFISFMGSTPGQYFLKLHIVFKNKHYPLFLQALARQFGFAFSFLALGLPFIKALSDENAQCFYEKMTDSQIFSKWPADRYSYFHKNIELDRKFWSASSATLSSFLILLGLVTFWESYQQLLTSQETYVKIKNKTNSSCNEFVRLNSTDRLRYTIAMNLVGTVSDKCLDQEADFVLWRNFTDDRSLAYFAKFISSANQELESEYLSQACVENKKSEGCYWASIFKRNNFSDISKNKNMSQTLLGKVLLYEFGEKENSKSKQKIFRELKEYADFKSIKKYLLLESLNASNPINKKSLSVTKYKSAKDVSNKRIPASVDAGEGTANSLAVDKSESPVLNQNTNLLNDDEIKAYIEDL